MGSFLAFPILIVAAILQASLIPQLELSGGGPNLVYVLVLAWSLNAPLEQAVVWSLVGGLSLDLLSAAPLGTSAIGLVLQTFILSSLGTQLFQLGILLLVFMSVFGTFVYEIFRMLLVGLFWLIGYLPATAPLSLDFSTAVTSTIAPTMLYNFILILPTYILLRLIQRRLRPVE
jgi:rod shape-determining protein MreD